MPWFYPFENQLNPPIAIIQQAEGNPSIAFYLILFVLSLGFGLVGTPAVRRLAEMAGVVDAPSARKIHVAPVPLLGGAAIYLAFIITVTVLSYYALPFKYVLQLGALILGASLMFFIGLLDDKWGLSPRLKLGGQLMAALWLVISDVKIEVFAVPALNILFTFANYLPIVADTFYKQGSNLASSQQWARAAPFFKQAVESAPSEDYYYLFLGQSYLEQARALIPDKTRSVQMFEFFNESEKALLKAHELALLNPDHYANLGRLYALWASADGSHYEEFMGKGINWYEQGVTSRAPRNARLRTELAAAYLNLALSKKNGPDQALIEKAIATGETAVGIDSSFDFSHLVLGDIYLIAKKPDKAGLAFLGLAKIDVKQLASDNKYNERIKAIANSPLVSSEEISNTFGIGPNSTDIGQKNIAAGGIYFYKGDLKQAESRLNAAFTTDRTNPYMEAYFALVKNRLSQGDIARSLAVDALEQARKINDNSQTLSVIQPLLAEFNLPLPAAQPTVAPAPANPTPKPVNPPGQATPPVSPLPAK